MLQEVEGGAGFAGASGAVFFRCVQEGVDGYGVGGALLQEELPDCGLGLPKIDNED